MHEKRFLFTNKADEFLNIQAVFALRLLKQQFAKTVISLLLALAIYVVLTIYISSFDFYKEAQIFAKDTIGIILLLVLWCLISQYLERYFSIEKVHPQGAFLIPQEYIFDENGIRCINANHSSLEKWTGILKIEEHKDMILLYTDIFIVHYIPKRVFESEQDAQGFLKEIHEIWEKSGKQSLSSILPRTSNRWQHDQKDT